MPGRRLPAGSTPMGRSCRSDSSFLALASCRPRERSNPLMKAHAVGVVLGKSFDWDGESGRRRKLRRPFRLQPAARAARPGRRKWLAEPFERLSLFGTKSIECIPARAPAPRSSSALPS